MNLNERYLVDAQGNRLGVFLDLADYQKILKILETLHDETTRDKEINAPSSLEELFDRAAVEKERLTLTYQNKVFLVVVPIEDVKVIKQLSDCIHEAAKNNQTEIESDLDDLFDRAATQMVAMGLTYQDKVFLAVVPISDLELIEQLEDCIDNANADDALKEEGSISLDDFIKELGL